LPARYPGRAHIDPDNIWSTLAARTRRPRGSSSRTCRSATGRANLGTLVMVEAALRSAKTGSSPARL